MPDDCWSLDELVQRVSAALADGDTRQLSRRVRPTPDRRAIRWYTTVGLLDRPQLRGRTGWYGLRHLLQLVAIKRMQAQGVPLAQIQAELAGASDAALLRVAQLPEAAVATEPGTGVADSTVRTRSAFWTAQPAQPVQPTQPAAQPTQPAQPARSVPLALPTPDGASSESGVVVRSEWALGRGVKLLVDMGSADAQAPNPDDLAAARQAARPLLELLTRRGFVPAGNASPTRTGGPAAGNGGPASKGGPDDIEKS